MISEIFGMMSKMLIFLKCFRIEMVPKSSFFFLEIFGMSDLLLY